jgi:hypothetical protein
MRILALCACLIALSTHSQAEEEHPSGIADSTYELILKNVPLVLSAEQGGHKILTCDSGQIRWDGASSASGELLAVTICFPAQAGE